MDTNENPKVDRTIDRILALLRKEYVIMGSTHVKAWRAWLLVGLAAGILIGIILVANRGGEFDSSRADTTDQAISEDYSLLPTISLASQNLPEEQAAIAGRGRILELVRKIPLASSATRLALVAELSQRLRDRRKLIAALIEKDPNCAWTSLLPASVIAALPPEVKDDAETPALLSGKIETIYIDADFPVQVSNSANPQSGFRYFLKTATEHLNLHPVGGELPLRSGTPIKVSGYRLGSALLAPVGVNGIEVTGPPPPPEALGEQKALVVLVDFQDSGPQPFTSLQAKDFIFNGNVNKFYQEASYGKTWWSGDVAGWITLPRNSEVNGICQLPSLTADGLDVIITSQYNLHNYGYLTILSHQPCLEGGFSDLGKHDQVINGETFHISLSLVVGDNFNEEKLAGFTVLDYLLSHEWGHGLGVRHANSWECGFRILYGICSHIEYGNWFDIMGYPMAALHFNGLFKDALGWLSPGMLEISKSGIYTINVLEKPDGYPAAKILSPGLGTTPFYLEYRKPLGFDLALAATSTVSTYGPIPLNGLFVNREFNLSTYPGPASRLLDFMPGSILSHSDWTNVILQVGKLPFYDPATGITIGPVFSVDDTKITFRVNVGNPHCIRQNPAILLWQKSFDVIAGDTFDIAMEIQNLDSAFCGSSPFMTTATAPMSWPVTVLGPNPTTIPPQGESGYQTVEVVVPNTTPAGSYVVKVIVKNTTATLRSTWANFTVNVK